MKRIKVMHIYIYMITLEHLYIQHKIKFKFTIKQYPTI